MRERQIYIALTLLLLSSCSLFVRNNNRTQGFYNKTQYQNTLCESNVDSTYNRVLVLQKLATALNESVPEFEKSGHPNGFTIENGRCSKFCVYDLVNPSNIDKGIGYENESIEMINNHIYHFVPILERFSYSHIAILDNGNVKIFYSVNCESRGGNNIEDVLKEVKILYANHPKKNYILRQVKNYRQHRIYLQVDPEGAFFCK